MNMIEKVARALAESDKNNWDGLTRLQKVCLYTNAKAAIQAMLEPTEEMLELVTNADGFFKVNDPIQAWKLMIQAALKD